MHLKTFVAAAFAMLLAACNPMAQLDGVEEKVEQFQQTYNSGDAEALYGLTSDEFRSVTTPEEMEALVALVTEKMGGVESSERTGFNIDAQTDVTTTVVTMNTAFERGEGVETFTFHGQGGDIRLVGWNVESDNFLEDAEAQGEGEVAETETAEPAE